MFMHLFNTSFPDHILLALIGVTPQLSHFSGIMKDFLGGSSLPTVSGNLFSFSSFSFSNKNGFTCCCSQPPRAPGLERNSRAIGRGGGGGLHLGWGCPSSPIPVQRKTPGSSPAHQWGVLPIQLAAQGTRFFSSWWGPGLSRRMADDRGWLTLANPINCCRGFNCCSASPIPTHHPAALQAGPQLNCPSGCRRTAAGWLPPPSPRDVVQL